MSYINQALLDWSSALPEHTCTEPQSSDFRDGPDAAGCWTDSDGLHYEQVVGSSGVYLIATDADGNMVRDDRPWQMRV